MSTRWSVSRARSDLATVIEQAKHGPQVIENRGEPVAVVLAPEAYERLTPPPDAAPLEELWKRLDAIAARSPSGGLRLARPRKSRARDPFA